MVLKNSPMNINSKKMCLLLSVALVEWWIRHRTSKPGIVGSSPGEGTSQIFFSDPYFFESLLAFTCHFFWKTFSGIWLGMELSTKYQNISPGKILRATLIDRWAWFLLSVSKPKWITRKHTKTFDLAYPYPMRFKNVFPRARVTHLITDYVYS